MKSILNDRGRTRVPAYIRAAKTRQQISYFFGTLIIITIIWRFDQYGFLAGLLFLLGGAIVWWVINFILRKIFSPIIADLKRQYDEK